MKYLVIAAAAALALAGALPANANVVTSSSSSFTINDDVTTAITGGPADLLGSVSFSGFSFVFDAGSNTTAFTMNMNIVNSTNAALFPSGRLTAVGFNINPDATQVSDTSAVFDSFLNQTFPSFQKVDVCSSTGNTCAGGGGGDLAPGASNSFAMTLTLSGNQTSIDLGANVNGDPEVFDFKWQTGIGSFESQCTFGSTCTTTAPEPATIGILGFSLLGLGLIRRRR